MSAAIKTPMIAPVYVEEAVETEQDDVRGLRSGQRVEQQVHQHSRGGVHTCAVTAGFLFRSSEVFGWVKLIMHIIHYTHI